MPASVPPPSPGWYHDPYGPDSIRWFDGTEWTIHAVPSNEPDPDQVVHKYGDARAADGVRGQEWRDQFPWWDTAIAQGDEPPFNGAGGIGGLVANREARFATRLVARLRHRAAWLTGVIVAVFSLLALGDPTHRTVLVALGTGLLAIVLIVEDRGWPCGMPTGGEWAERSEVMTSAQHDL